MAGRVHPIAFSVSPLPPGVGVRDYHLHAMHYDDIRPHRWLCTMGTRLVLSCATGRERRMPSRHGPLVRWTCSDCAWPFATWCLSRSMAWMVTRTLRCLFVLVLFLLIDFSFLSLLVRSCPTSYSFHLKGSVSHSNTLFVRQVSHTPPPLALLLALLFSFLRRWPLQQMILR